MNEIYFENVTKVGNLYLEKVFNRFEDENIIFVCKDACDQRYLCICYEFRASLKWILCKISSGTLARLITKRIDIRNAFELDGNEWIQIVYREGIEESEIVSEDNMCENILPRYGVYLKADQDNSNYLRYICFHYMETASYKCRGSLSYALNRQKPSLVDVIDGFSPNLFMAYNLSIVHEIREKEILFIDLNDAA